MYTKRPGSRAHVILLSGLGPYLVIDTYSIVAVSRTPLHDVSSSHTVQVLGFFPLPM